MFLPKTAAILFSEKDVYTCLQAGVEVDAYIPVTQKAWVAAKEAGLTVEYNFWNYQGQVDYLTLDAQFTDTDKEWGDFVTRTLAPYSNNLKNFPLAKMSRVALWARVRERRYMHDFTSTLIDQISSLKTLWISGLGIQDIPISERVGLSPIYGLKEGASTKNVSVNEWSVELETKLTSPIHTQPLLIGGVAVLTFGMSNLGERIAAFAKQDCHFTLYVTPHFSGNPKRVANLISEIPNIDIQVIDEGEVKQSYAEYKDLFEPLIELGKDKHTPKDFLDIATNNWPYYMEMLSIVTKKLINQKPSKLIITDHEGCESRAFLAYAEEHNIPVQAYTHTLWPLLEPHELQGERFVSYTAQLRSAAEQSNWNSDKIIIAPFKSLWPGKFRNLYRAYLSKKKARHRKHFVLGVIYTSSLTYASTDIALIDSLAPLAETMQGLPEDTTIVMRLRGEEDKASIIANILSDIGAPIDQLNFMFETMADVPIRDFAYKCDLVIELGIASSACHELITRFVPCVRLAPQLRHRKRFGDRKIPVLDIEDIQKYLFSPALRSSLINEQHKKLSMDMRPGILKRIP